MGVRFICRRRELGRVGRIFFKGASSKLNLSNWL